MLYKHNFIVIIKKINMFITATYMHINVLYMQIILCLYLHKFVMYECIVSVAIP